MRLPMRGKYGETLCDDPLVTEIHALKRFYFQNVSVLFYQTCTDRKNNSLFNSVRTSEEKD